MENLEQRIKKIEERNEFEESVKHVFVCPSDDRQKGRQMHYFARCCVKKKNVYNENMKKRIKTLFVNNVPTPTIPPTL